MLSFNISKLIFNKKISSKEILLNKQIITTYNNENYNQCMQKETTFFEINKLKQELDTDLKKYSISVYYQDLNSGASYIYNPNKIYFGASLIKLLDGLYLYTNASDGGEVDLNTTIKYTSNFMMSYSEQMKQRKINEQITLKELVNYALSVSDNTAHFMLFNHIGKEKLKSYAKDLGIKKLVPSTGIFGSLNILEAHALINEAYKFIESKNKLSAEFRSFLENDTVNYLRLATDKPIIHKYGSTDSVYHDIGIVYHNYPYSISILTNEKQKRSEIFFNVHSKIIDMHDTYIKLKQKECSLSQS